MDNAMVLIDLRSPTLHALLLLFAPQTESPHPPALAGYGYGYGGLGYGGYGQEELAGASSPGRSLLLAPQLAYGYEGADVQSRVKAGASWNPSAASIELQGAVRRALQQFEEDGDELLEAGQRASSRQQFDEESDEIVVGPVPRV